MSPCGHTLLHMFSIYSELTALLDFVSEGRGFSFMHRTRRSLSTSSIPYFWVSVQTHTELMWAWGKAMFDMLGWDSLPSLTASTVLQLKPHFLLTLLFALVREHQTAVLTLCLQVRKPLFDFTEAEIFFEESVAVMGRNRSWMCTCNHNSAW